MTIIEEHYKRSFNRLVKRLSFRAGSPQDAEDIVQDAYERALKYIDAYDVEQDFEIWFGRIMFNCLKDHNKKSRGYTVVEFEEHHGGGEDCRMLPKEALDQIWKRIDSKPAEFAEILRLHFKNGYSINDINKIVGGKYDATAQTIKRFRLEMREMFG